MPLSSAGLWLAEIITPRSARIDRVIRPTAGVGTGPRSSTFIPVDVRPAVSALSNMYPDRRVSLPITTRCTPLASRRKYRPTAAPMRSAISAVIGCVFAVPRTPSVPNSLRILTLVPGPVRGVRPATDAVLAPFQPHHVPEGFARLGPAPQARQRWNRAHAHRRAAVRRSCR